MNPDIDLHLNLAMIHLRHAARLLARGEDRACNHVDMVALLRTQTDALFLKTQEEIET